MRKYPKVYRADNYVSGGMGEFPKNEPLIIQEKLDGSNVTIEFIKGETQPRIYSRKIEIKRENPGNWKTLVEWVDKHFKIKYKPTGYALRLHGEWLMQAKLPYNKTHANSFWLFDVALKETKDTPSRLVPFDMVKEFAKVFNLNLIPHFKETITLTEFIKDSKWKEYVEGQKTLLPDSTSAREGVVLKTLDGKHRMKFVSAAFKESIGNRKERSVPLFSINDELITEARTQKYIHKLKEMNILPLHVDYNDGKTIGKIFKNQKLLVDDFMEEEFEAFMKIVEKQIKRNVGRTVKSYIVKQQELATLSLVKDKEKTE